MILITGATGFVGSNLLVALRETGEDCRVLLHPSRRDPQLPQQQSIDVTLASLSDRRGLRAAMMGVDTVVHLASAARHGHRADLQDTDVQGTEFLVAAAADAQVQRFLFLSHLGASPASAFPLLRAKSRAEGYIRRSRMAHCILRSGLVFGPNDWLTTPLAMSLASSPVIFPLPGDGSTLIHPLWIHDLTGALLLLLGADELPQGTHEIGGPEHMSVRQLVELVADHIGARRQWVGVHPAYLRGIVWLLERVMPHPPFTTHDVDYLASPRTAPLDSMARLVRIQPSRMVDRLDYLERGAWGWDHIRRQISGRPAHVS